jgi:hypothetical protein
MHSIETNIMNTKLAERKEQADQAWTHWSKTREDCRLCYRAAVEDRHFSTVSESWAKYDKAVKVNQDAFRSAHAADEYYWHQESWNSQKPSV